ncbi:MAG: protease modulator HflC [Gammaproteobacteria bacterium]|nr:protease modulator HflC [Gammaproteobacteria bacterium]MDH5800722.1 protease modulator HflC [Gammaproteobacteria bacterium]
MAQLKMLGGFIAVAILLVASFAVFIVDERDKVILFRLGEIVKTDFAPGLYFKMPFVNNVRKFDSRIQTLDAKPERYLTSEKKNVIVDSFVKWRINNVSSYYTTTGGDALRANERLSQFIKDGLRGEFGKRTIQEVISGERKEIMDLINAEANKLAETFGIEVVDVRIKRVDLAENVSASVYSRMEAERERVAKDYRARGREEAEKIKAEANREATIIEATAFKEAETLKGDGDAKASKIYADAYKKDAEFYSLYRSLNAYKTTFADKNDVLVIEPNSEFFKYFK